MSTKEYDSRAGYSHKHVLARQFGKVDPPLEVVHFDLNVRDAVASLDRRRRQGRERGVCRGSGGLQDRCCDSAGLLDARLTHDVRSG